MFQDKKRTVQVVDNDCAVPIFVAFPRVVFDVNSSKSATFYFYDLSSKSRNRPHYDRSLAFSAGLLFLEKVETNN